MKNILMDLVNQNKMSVRLKKNHIGLSDNKSAINIKEDKNIFCVTFGNDKLSRL